MLMHLYMAIIHTSSQRICYCNVAGVVLDSEIFSELRMNAGFSS